MHQGEKTGEENDAEVIKLGLWDLQVLENTVPCTVSIRHIGDGNDLEILPLRVLGKSQGSGKEEADGKCLRLPVPGPEPAIIARGKPGIRRLKEIGQPLYDDRFSLRLYGTLLQYQRVCTGVCLCEIGAVLGDGDGALRTGGKREIPQEKNQGTGNQAFHCIIKWA